MSELKSWTLALTCVALVSTMGCSSKKHHHCEGANCSNTDADVSVTDAGSIDGGAGVEADGAAVVNTLLKDGEYFMGIKLSLAGAQLRMKAVIAAEGEKGKGGTLTKVELYGLGASGDWVSESPIATAEKVEVSAEGTFKMDLGKVTVPAKSSPTGTPVESNLTVIGTIDSDANTFCGDLEGDIPAFEADLKGSTFKAVSFGSEKDPYEVSCNTEVKVYEGITTCPTLKAGVNKLTSATFERAFVLSLPADSTATAARPIVFVYHGNTGSAQGILNSTAWPALQASQTDAPFILVAPETTADVNGSKPVLDWRYGEKAFDMDNRELVFFDDVLKCVSEQFNGDSKRVYVTGMSAGGMMSTFLAAHRGDKIAAAAPLSGGYLHPWPTDATKVPMLVTWGGETDEAYQQNFHTLAQNLIKALTDAGWWFALCNHKTGHEIPKDFTPHVWAFFSAHELGAEPAFKSGLPTDFPSFCSLAD